MDLTRLQKNFELHGFSYRYFETRSEAAAYLAQQTAGKFVSFGGSMTLDEMNLYDILKPHADVRWHWKGDGYVQDAEIYITSANAISETGEVVNIDGAGNRVSATLYGPKQVFFVCGINKIAPDLSAAIERAQNIAAPKNAQRLGVKTPCAVNGDRCYDCKSPQRICRGLVVLWEAIRSCETEVVLVDEPLGY